PDRHVEQVGPCPTYPDTDQQRWQKTQSHLQLPQRQRGDWTHPWENPAPQSPKCESETTTRRDSPLRWHRPFRHSGHLEKEFHPAIRAHQSRTSPRQPATQTPGKMANRNQRPFRQGPRRPSFLRSPGIPGPSGEVHRNRPPNPRPHVKRSAQPTLKCACTAQVKTVCTAQVKTVCTAHVGTGDSPVHRSEAPPPTQPRSGAQECSPRRQPWVRMHRRTSPEGAPETSPKQRTCPCDLAVRIRARVTVAPQG